jgi:hypothetical protein
VFQVGVESRFQGEKGTVYTLREHASASEIASKLRQSQPE